MVLEFINQGGQTKAEFKATANFNLHIEGVPQGGVRVYQSSAEGGKYALIQESVITPSAGNVYDFDFIGEIFPKFIKVVCANQPTYAEVVSSGEVTEIKSQSVEIEITSNGIQEVMADAGFAYMDRVTIKTNVPQSGEGGEKRAYITMEAFEAVKNTLNGNDAAAFEFALLSYCDFIKTNVGVVSGSLTGMLSPTAMSINLTFRCASGVFLQTFEEALKDTTEGAQSAWETIPKITEAEFYTL